MGRGNLAEETAAAIGLPAPEQQQETIRQLQPRASWQPPIKDDGTHIDEQDIVDVLVIGSGFCEGRFRIQEFFSATVLPTVKEQADWLKKEYGIGGRTWDFRDGERGFLDYDAKGLRIKRYASDNDPDYFRLLPWNEVARRLHLLVHNDQYLDENNKQGYEKWEAEQQAKVRGKTSLDRLLREGKEMKIIPLQTKDLAQFKAYAKQYGVLFASIKDKGAQGEKIDIMFKAEDVSKLNRIYEQLGYTVPKKISADRKNAETRRQMPDPMLTRGKTMEDIDPRPSFKTVAAQLRKAAARSAERAVNATRKTNY